MKNAREERNDVRPVVGNDISGTCRQEGGNGRNSDVFSKIQFKAMFLGGLIGSILGTVFFKILTHLI